MTSFSSWRRLLRSDPLLLQAGAAGELTVARLRLLLTAILLVVPAVTFLAQGGGQEPYIGLGVTLVAVVVAGGVYSAVQRDLYRPWVGLVTTVFDVTFISATLAVFLFIGGGARWDELGRLMTASHASLRDAAHRGQQQGRLRGVLHRHRRHDAPL